MNEPNEKEFNEICVDALVKMISVFGDLPEGSRTPIMMLNILNNLNYNFIMHLIDAMEPKDPSMTKSEARRLVFRDFFADIQNRLDALDRKEGVKKQSPSMSPR